MVTYRALPPAEHMVLVAWYENARQLDLARSEDGFAYVRLGRRHGALHVHPNLSTVRHVLLRTHDAKVALGLLRLREIGFRVFTRRQLRTELEKHAKGKGVAAWEGSAGKDEEEIIYALFRTQPDHAWDTCEWDGERLMDLIENFESDIFSIPIFPVGAGPSIRARAAMPKTPVYEQGHLVGSSQGIVGATGL